MIDYNKMAEEIHAQNKKMGWWDKRNQCIYEKLQLVSTEIAEATEGERKNLMDDHLPNRKMGEVELADALIRLLDIGGRYGWKFRPVWVKSDFKDYYPIAAKHLFLNCLLVDLVRSLNRSFDEIDSKYSELILSIVATAETHNYCIYGAMIEKLEYNKHRADHKRENRAKTGGKEF